MPAIWSHGSQATSTEASGKSPASNNSHEALKWRTHGWWRISQTTPVLPAETCRAAPWTWRDTSPQAAMNKTLPSIHSPFFHANSKILPTLSAILTHVISCQLSHTPVHGVCPMSADGDAENQPPDKPFRLSLQDCRHRRTALLSEGVQGLNIASSHLPSSWQ